MQTGIVAPYTRAELEQVPLRRLLRFQGFSKGLQERRAKEQGDASVENQYRAFMSNG
jgi:hypothetical protein